MWLQWSRSVLSQVAYRYVIFQSKTNLIEQYSFLRFILFLSSPFFRSLFFRSFTHLTRPQSSPLLVDAPEKGREGKEESEVASFLLLVTPHAPLSRVSSVSRETNGEDSVSPLTVSPEQAIQIYTMLF